MGSGLHAGTFYLHFIHPVHNVEHFLEYLLQPQVHLEALPPGPEQLQQVLPEPDDVVLPRRDALDVVVVLRFQLPGHGHHGLHALLVRGNVRLDGLVLFRGSLDCGKVKSKVVLREKGTKRKEAQNSKAIQFGTKKQKMEVDSWAHPLIFEGGVPKPNADSQVPTPAGLRLPEGP